MSSLACASKGCAGVACVPDDVEARLRRTHETFYCPFGHSMSFSGENETEQWKRKAEMYERRMHDWQRMWRDAEEAFGQCPLCDYRSSAHTSRRWFYLLRHFAKAHKDEGGWALFLEFQRVRTEQRESA